jgi:hypothetical protein
LRAAVPRDPDRRRQGAIADHRAAPLRPQLERLRFELRLAHDLGLLSHGQYRHAAALLAEVGRLLGAWIKKDNAQRRS